MGSPTVSIPSSTYTEQYRAPLLSDGCEEFAETRESRSRAGRGALTGILLGAGLWVAILTVTGVIKL
jgi:hypothetical protein